MYDKRVVLLGGEAVIDTKICSICKIEKFLNEFYSQNRYSKIKGNYIYYNPECKKCTIKKTTKWLSENHDKVLKYYITKNNKPEVKKEIQRRTKIRREEGKIKEYQRKHPDKIKQYNENRKHKNHNITEKEWLKCKEYFNYECAYCGIHLNKHFVKYAGKIILGDFSKEHVDDDGNNNLGNCIPGCKSCNSKKWKFEFEEWYKKQEFFTEERYNKIIKWLKEDWIKYKDDKL